MYCLLLQYILSRNRMGHGPNEKGMIMMACARSLVRAQSAIYFATIGEKSNIRVTMTLTRKGWSGTIYYPQTGA